MDIDNIYGMITSESKEHTVYDLPESPALLTKHQFTEEKECRNYMRLVRPMKYIATKIKTNLIQLREL